jgi:hypothetical protein
MKYQKAKNIRIVMPKAALATVFDECDRFDHDETGGRIIGTVSQADDTTVLTVQGVIDAGPRAQRSAVSFFQDGEYQEQIFRKLEGAHPDVEHLGNWHTHHVNGLTTLSSGDIATYGRTVNHEKHNIPFFYALLVVARTKNRDSLRRYKIRHFLFRRGDERVYEIPSKLVKVVDGSLIIPRRTAEPADRRLSENLGAEPQRFYDRQVLSEFYERFRPFASESVGLYWRGQLELLDGSKIQVVVVEESSSGNPSYSVVCQDPPGRLAATTECLSQERFSSARAALITTERRCNQAIYGLREQDAASLS